MTKAVMRKIIKQTFERNDNAIPNFRGIGATWYSVGIISKNLFNHKFEPGYLKKSFESEHGFIYPTPTILKGKLKFDVYVEALKHLYNPQVIVALMKDIAVEATKRNIDVTNKSAYDAKWEEFFGKKHMEVKIINSFKYDLDRDIEEDYLYSWSRAGGYHGESRICVGLVLCNLLVCFKTRDISLVWWERETQVMQSETLQKWFEEIILDFNQSCLDMNEAILKYMKKAQDFCDKAEEAAKDKSVHLYQNPNMETFWIGRGDIRKAKKLIEQNKHPASHKELLPTLNSKAVEKAIVENVIDYIVNMDKIMVNWHLSPGPANKLTPISQLLLIRLEQAMRADDKEEQRILIKMAEGDIRMRLQEKLSELKSDSQDYLLINDYINQQLDKDMKIFFEKIGHK